MPNRVRTDDSSLLIERLAGRIESVEKSCVRIDAQIHDLIVWKEDHDRWSADANRLFVEGIAKLNARLEEFRSEDRSRWEKVFATIIQPLLHLVTLGALAALAMKGIPH